MSPTMPSAASGPLLLADISGYTSFLQSVAVAHRDDAFADGAVPDAYAMISDLLDGIAERVVPPFTLSKLEGDAVFAYAVDPAEMPRGGTMLDCLTEGYADFRRRLGMAHSIWSCRCGAARGSMTSISNSSSMRVPSSSSRSREAGSWWGPRWSWRIGC